jgi:two-component system KDP operon response regulator KdpE
MGELLARLPALPRRGVPEAEEPVVTTDHLTIDLAAKQVTLDGAAVRPTPREWAVLSELMRSPGRLVSQRQLLQTARGPGGPGGCGREVHCFPQPPVSRRR